MIKTITKCVFNKLFRILVVIESNINQFDRNDLVYKRNCAELEIIEGIMSLNISGQVKDDITDIVKDALDRQFK